MTSVRDQLIAKHPHLKDKKHEQLLNAILGIHTQMEPQNHPRHKVYDQVDWQKKKQTLDSMKVQVNLAGDTQ